MAQTPEGAIKAAARGAGVSPEEYVRLVAAGQKWCMVCRRWQPVGEFGSDRSRVDGLASGCREGRNSWMRERYVSRAVPPGERQPRLPISAATRRQMSVSAKARGSNRTGAIHSPEARARISAGARANALRGPYAPAYKDGKVAERRGERFSAEYKRWRYDVFTRDAFTCQNCGDAQGGNLVAHHMKGFSAFPELRYVLANGITWCETCHKAHHEENGYG